MLNRLKFLLLFLATCSLLVISFIPAFAEGETPDYVTYTTSDNTTFLASKTQFSKDGNPDNLKTIDKGENAWEMAVELYGASDDAMKDIKEILSLSTTVTDFKDSANLSFEGSDSTIVSAKNSILQIAANVYNALRNFGAAFIALYFMIDLIDKSTRELASIENVLKGFLKLIVAIMILNNGLHIVVWFLNISTDLMNIVGDPSNSSGFVSAAQADKLYEIGVKLTEGTSFSRTISAILYLGSMIIPWLGLQVASIIIWYMAWSRFLELGVRVAFAPIGMADMFTEGTKGSGFRYFKRLIAVMIQGMFIIIIISFVRSIEGVWGGVPGSQLLSRFVLLFTEIGLIKRSQTLANDLLGV